MGCAVLHLSYDKLVASPIALWLGISHENLMPVEKEGEDLDDQPLL